MNTPIDRILLPIVPGDEQPHVLRSATVLSSWFGAPLQIVSSDQSELSPDWVAVGTLGVSSHPMLHLDDVFGQELVDYANTNGPSIIIAAPSTAGRALAAASGQPVFLVADNRRRRMPVGPLLVELTGEVGDLDALALTAVLACALDESVRLIVDADGAQASGSNSGGEERLRQMGCDVGTDVVEAGDLPALVRAARARDATAIVIAADRLQEPDLVDAAMAHAVNVFVAPLHHPDTRRHAPPADDVGTDIDRSVPGAPLGRLDRGECLARLNRHSMARVGYIDRGWPVVVPVNYRIHEGAVFIRSLAGGKLRAAERGDTVCLELDGFDEALRTGWSVVAHGHLEIIGDPAVLNEAWVNDPHPWVASDSWQWLRMVPISLTGREVWPGAAPGPERVGPMS